MTSSRWPRSPSHGKCSKRFCGSSRSYGRSHHQRCVRRSMSCIQSSRQKECVQMPGKMARSNPRPSVRVTRGAGSGQHLASVLQEGRENANIDAGWDSSGESRLISDKFTFVTVVFEAEYDLLSLQARSMRLYCPLEIVQGILVIDNSRTPISLNRQDRIRREYGHLSHFVQFVRYKQLAKMPDGEVLRLLGIWRGWYTQQVA